MLDNGEYIEIFPEAKYKVDLWKDTLDQEGQPRLDKKKFWEYVNKSKANKREEKLKRKAKEAQQKKF